MKAIIDPAIYDVNMLNDMLSDCRAWGAPDPRCDDFAQYPAWINHTIFQIVTLMHDAICARAARGSTEGLT